MGKIIYNLRENRKGDVVSKENRAYDKFGRLAETAAGFSKSVKYAYDAKGRIARQTVGGTPIDYVYTKYGQLAGKYLGGKQNPEASVEYEYSKSGQIVARTANGARQTYEYDGRGQLLAVKNADGSDAERYAYDKAGNMVRKTVGGKTTTFTFDGANQLVSSTTDDVTTKYAYDAAGRLVREGAKTYRYGYLDKVLSVADGKNKFTYDYHVDGQLASANYGDGKSESFLWDGLALVKRGDEQFINEPHVGGGNPVVSSKGTSYFNDMLGTTLGSKAKYGKYSAAALTAFGEDISDASSCSPFPVPHSPFFTGKPHVPGLGHAFLFRNYRAGLAKWQTADPLGYPDGWNALAYCNNGVTSAVDILGAKVYAVFSISNQRLVVYDWDTAKKIVVQAFSGKENYRSVEYQWVPNFGPLPLGEYAIVSASEAHPSWFELWRYDGTLDDETFGPGGVRRGEFRLHEGNVSLGCITMKISDEAKAIVNMLKSTSYDWKLLSFKKIYGTLKVVE